MGKILPFNKKPKHIFHNILPKKGTFHDATSKELYTFFKGYNAKTVEAEKKREKIKLKQQAKIKNLQGIVDSTLKDVHGAHPDSENTPDSYDLAGAKDGEKHAVSLLDKLMGEFYKQHHTEEAFKLHKDSPTGKKHMLKAFNNHLAKISNGRLDYSSLLNSLTSQTDYASSEDFGKILSSLHHVEEAEDIETVESLLQSDRRHKGYVLDKANELYMPKGVEVKDTAQQHEVFGALKSALDDNQHKIQHIYKKLFKPLKYQKAA